MGKPQPECSEPRDEFAHLCALKLDVVQIENMLLQMAVSGKLQGQVDDEALKKVALADHTRTVQTGTKSIVDHTNHSFHRTVAKLRLCYSCWRLTDRQIKHQFRWLLGTCSARYLFDLGLADEAS